MGGPMMLCFLPFPAVAVASTYFIWKEGQLAEARGILGAGVFWAMAIGVFWAMTSVRHPEKYRLTWGLLFQAFLAALPAGLLWQKSYIHHLDLNEPGKRRGRRGSEHGPSDTEE
jgi:hypothetical protein